tara:strand:- start:635 stop:805 length:171 start_codon:yes stop_codon:yes gene_type:complete
MESHRQKLNDLIEQAAKRRNVSSKWELVPPKRPSQKDIEAAQCKGNIEEQYRLFDR